MTKKLWGKLLSVILTIAICATTVFGCLITANAADVECYTWSDGIVAEDLTSATINLNLIAPTDYLADGIYEAMFSVGSENDALVLEKVEVTDGTRVDGAAFSAEDYSYDYIEENKTVDVFASSTDANASALTLTLTFSFADGVATQGAKYYATIANLEMTDGFGEGDYISYTGAATSGLINAGCDHVYSVAGLTPIQTNTVDGYYVYANVPCSKCSEVNPYQVVPATELKNVIYWDGTTVTEPTTTDADGNILITSAAELAWITSNTVTGNYKVADGIDAIVLQSEAYAEAIMALADAEQTKAYFEANKSALTAWKNNGVFQGTFDGNGVEIYGMVTSSNGQGGLFACATDGSTFKNLAVKNSYIMSGDYVGAVVGKLYSTTAHTAVIAESTITFDKLIVANNYMKVTHGNYNRVGIIFGGEQTWDNTSNGQLSLKWVPIVVTNSLVYSNIGFSTQYPDIVPGLFGCRNGGWNGLTSNPTHKYENIIALDCIPYAYTNDGVATTPAGTKATNQATYAQYYTNVYTNYTTDFIPCSNQSSWSAYDGKIILIDKADVKGVNAQSIVDKFGGDWQIDPLGGYPKFEGDTVSIDGTSDNWQATSELKETGPDTAYGFLDGNLAGSGTESDPYLITNAEELAYVVRGADGDTDGEYYKVADGIKSFHLNTFKDTDGSTKWINGDSDLDQIVESFGTGGNNLAGNVGSNDYTFAGHFDGNGVTIYGLFAGRKWQASTYGGLFDQVMGNVTIKNIKLEKAVIYGVSYVGGIVGNYVQSAADDRQLTIENCSVTDSYIATTSYVYSSSGNKAQSNLGGIVGYAALYNSSASVAQAHATIKNCFVNLDSDKFISPAQNKDEACYLTATYGGIAGNVNADDNYIDFNNCLVLGVKPYTVWAEGASVNANHSAAADNFVNCYTDQSLNEGIAYSKKQNYDGKITQISVADVKGAAAKDTLAGFDFDTVWTYDGNGGYPTPVPQPAIGTVSQLNLNLLGANISYNNDGSFNFNFYYDPANSDIVPVLYVGRADGDGFTKLNGTALGADEAAALGVAEGTLRYSIKNISAREIGDTFLPTAVAKQGISTVYGKTEPISVNDYAEAIISDSSVDAADKQVAAALVNYGSVATSVFEAANPVITEKKIVYVDASNINQTAPTKGSGTEADPFIIENAHHIRYIAQKSTPDTTYGVYYKVDPTIDVMVFQTESYIKSVAGSLDAFLALDAEGTKTALSNTSGRIQYQSGTTASGYASFAGTIDFSGVTICGMYNKNGGLIAIVNGGATFKNLTLCNNLIESGWYNGNLVGYVHNGSAASSETIDNGDGTTTTKNIYKPLTISNIAIHDCYQTTTGNGYSQTGVLIGTGEVSKNMPFYISNVITYDNISLGQTSSSDTTMVDCALYGKLPAGWNGESDGVANAKFDNIVTLDCVPYPTQSINNQLTRSQFWSNVYTTQLTEAVPCTNGSTDWADYDITKLSSADLALGAAAKDNMPGLDWGNIWFANSIGYPTLNQTGVTFEKTGKIIYWDNTKTDSTLADKGETGTVDNPIIIDSAEELFQLTNVDNYSATAGKYYKIADGIDTMVLQPEGKLDLYTLLSCANASEVADYLTGVDGLSNWNRDVETWFDGHFDGNGVTIIGMYSNARSAGLFPTADGGIPDANKEDNTGITIGNFTLKNSYVLANSGQNRAGAIVGGTPGPNYGNKVDGVINFEKIAVENCYVQSAGSSGACGVFLGVQGNEIVRVNNCAVYGTEAYYTSSGALKNAALFNGYNGRKARDEAGNQIDGTFIDNTVSNSIILGIRPYHLWWTERVSNPRCITNVYTDQPLNPYSQATYTEENLIAVTADGLIGDGATSVVNALNNVAGKTLWYVGNNIDGMPGFAKASAVPTVFAAEYNSVAFNNFNDYGESTDDFGLYTTSLNLKNNPYMSLTFAFGNLDGVNTKYDRENIKVTVNGNVLPALPAYEEGVYISDVDGWTNKKGAGRYHMYKLDNLNIYDLSEPITVEIEYNGKTITNTISVEGFGLELQRAYTVVPCDYYSTRIEAVKALLFYTQALSEKYGA